MTNLRNPFAALAATFEHVAENETDPENRASRLRSAAQMRALAKQCELPSVMSARRALLAPLDEFTYEELLNVVRTLECLARQRGLPPRRSR